jgi:hypothetical protein
METTVRILRHAAEIPRAATTEEILVACASIVVAASLFATW